MFSLSVTDTIIFPKIAGATLSGWPSISEAIFSNWFLSKLAPDRAFAAITPATIQEALLPRPLHIGTSLWIFILIPAGIFSGLTLSKVLHRCIN